MKKKQDAPLPNDINLERVVLGSAINDKIVLEMAIESMSLSDWYLQRHKDIFEIVKAMYEQKTLVDTISLESRLTLMDREDLIEYVIDLSGTVCTQENAESHIKEITNLSTMRKMAIASLKINSLCVGYEGDCQKVVDTAEGLLRKAVDRNKSENAATMSNVMSSTFEYFEKRDRGEMLGVTTGYDSIDSRILGFEPGVLYIIAGRSSMGKTALALSMALKQAMLGIPVAYFSLEMSANHQIGMRLISLLSGIPLQTLRTKRNNTEDAMLISQIAGDISKLPLYIEPERLLSVDLFRSKLRRMKKKYGTCIAYVDYLQLMDRKGKGEYDGISDISRKLKIATEDFDMPITALSQLSRNKNAKENRPTLSDLRGSGSIEQDADAVMFVHREWYYDKTNGDKNEAEVMIAKQRNGPVEDVKMRFRGECATFEDKEEW